MWWGNNLPIALAGNLVDRVNAYPEWRSKPTVKVATGDLPYPDWMAGNWTVKIDLVDRKAPLAPSITTPGFDDRSRDLQKPIEFPVRFIEKPLVSTEQFSFPVPIIKKTVIVADRSFNSLSLGRAYLGENTLLAVKVDPENPNRQISFFRGDRQLLSTIVGRDSETPRSDRFHLRGKFYLF
ncbi:DUF6816 family protein [Pannus brasiliensis]|uniref:DUF6816 family protein n=1 Tax=Pannus brasiliensis TaxID=1579216 RepID=UPI002FCD7AEF